MTPRLNPMPGVGDTIRLDTRALLVMRDVYNFKVGEEINPSEGSKESYKKYTRKGHCDCSIDDYEV
jgi:hypothetical protein